MTTDLDRPTDPPASGADDTPDPGEGRSPRRPATGAGGSGAKRAPATATGKTAARPRAAKPEKDAKAARAARPATRPASSDGGDASDARLARFTPRLPWILALVGLLGTLGFGLAWLQADDGGPSGTTGGAGTSSELLDAAEAFSTALTNFDGATIDRDTDRIVARSSGEFRSQVDEFFSSEVRKQLKEAQASSRGEIRSAFVQSLDGDRGTVFVVADQTIANNQSPKPRSDTLRMELTLERVDGDWKVSRVDVLTAPSGGVTPAGASAADATTPAPAGN